MAYKTIVNGSFDFPDESQQVVRCARVVFGPKSGSDVSVTSSGTKNLLYLPANTVILDAKARVIEAFATGQKITIGDTSQAAGLFASADIAPQTAVTTGILKANAVSAYFNATGKLGGYKVPTARYISAVATNTGATKLSSSSAGQVELFLVYASCGSD